MYTYDSTSFRSVLEAILRSRLQPDNEALQKGAAPASIQEFNKLFVTAPRMTGRQVISLTGEEEAGLQAIRPGAVLNGWTADRLYRAWLLLGLNPSDREAYQKRIENLFAAAEMNEQVALYSALPLLAWPEAWRRRCSEGIRSNIGSVLEAIMCDNPYPSEQLEEAAWNQLVLKAFFTEKPIHRIIGLDARANKELAYILSDYAHERWAAGRPVHPMLWRCVGPFLDERLLPDIERVASSENAVEREAAGLACLQSSYEPAREIAARNKSGMSYLASGEITWETVARKLESQR